MVWLSTAPTWTSKAPAAPPPMSIPCIEESVCDTSGVTWAVAVPVPTARGAPLPPTGAVALAVPAGLLSFAWAIYGYDGIPLHGPPAWQTSTGRLAIKPPG